MMKTWTKLIISITVACLCCLFTALTGKLYFSSDNFEISLILNGYYGNPLSQYQHPLLCLIISAISSILLFADVFLLFIHITVLAVIAILFYLLAEKPMRKKPVSWKLSDFILFLIAVLAAVLLSAGFKVWYVNYTITAGAITAVGILTLFIAKERGKRNVWIIIGTVLTSIGFMLRKESGLLFIPFLLLIIFYVFLSSDEHRREGRRLTKYLLPVGIVIAVLLISQGIFNSVEPNSSAKRYNDARTAIMDYPMEPWEALEVDISHNDYEAAREWLFSDTEIMTGEKLEEIAVAGSKNKYEFNTEGIHHVLSEMWETAGRTDVYLSLTIILILTFTVRNTIASRSIWCILYSLLAPIGAFIIIAYFTFVGRAPLRVWEPVLFATLVTEIVIMMNGRARWSTTANTAFLLLLSIPLYYGTGQVIAHADFHEPQFALTGRANPDDTAYQETIDGDSLYIWPNWGGTIPKEAEKTGKLPSQAVIDHNIAIGYWTTGQPYYTAFLERIGHPNPIRDLVEKDNVYIMSNSTYIHNFLREHYGEDINLVEAGKVNGTLAYRVERGNTDE